MNLLATAIGRSLAGKSTPTKRLRGAMRAFFPGPPPWSSLLSETVGVIRLNLFLPRLRHADVNRALLLGVIDMARVPLITRTCMAPSPFEPWKSITTRFSMRKQGGPSGWPEVAHSRAADTLFTPTSMAPFTFSQISDRFSAEQAPAVLRNSCTACLTPVRVWR